VLWGDGRCNRQSKIVNGATAAFPYHTQQNGQARKGWWNNGRFEWQGGRHNNLGSAPDDVGLIYGNGRWYPRTGEVFQLRGLERSSPSKIVNGVNGRFA
jgi:hypothetical protein